jgi:hypothetical protein
VIPASSIHAQEPGKSAGVPCWCVLVSWEGSRAGREEPIYPKSAPFGGESSARGNSPWAERLLGLGRGTGRVQRSLAEKRGAGKGGSPCARLSAEETPKRKALRIASLDPQRYILALGEAIESGLALLCRRRRVVVDLPIPDLDRLRRYRLCIVDRLGVYESAQLRL